MPCFGALVPESLDAHRIEGATKVKAMQTLVTAARSPLSISKSAIYDPTGGNEMNPWICASLIAIFGGLGGVVNALLSDNGFALPRRESGVWCPGAISNILIGSFAAFSSWSFYGSGASIDLADKSLRAVMSLRFSALAGAFLVGVAGAKWITSEVDKRLLKETVHVAVNSDKLPKEQSEHITEGSPRQILQKVKVACESCAASKAA
jgi:hypothetical protein